MVKKVDTSEVANGRSRIAINNDDLTLKENNLTVEYTSPNKNYQNSTSNFTLRKEINTTLTIQEPTNTTIGNTSIPVTITETETQTPITTGNITITLPNGTIVTQVPVNPDTNGTTHVPIDLPAGTYNLTATYSGDNIYQPSQDTIENLEIQKTHQT